jgi:hypothetical protein
MQSHLLGHYDMYIQCSYVLVELLVQYNYRILEHVQYFAHDHSSWVEGQGLQARAGYSGG